MSLLASIRSSYIPMAPLTSLAFLCLGLLLLIRPMTWSRGGAGIVAAGLSALVSAYALVELVEETGTPVLSLEERLFPNPPMIGAIPGGRMSPTTAAVLLLAGAVVPMLVLRARRAGRRAFLGDLAGVLGTIVATGGAVFILGYLHGNPLLYGTATIPMAATTSLAVLLLGTGQVLAAGPESFPLRMFAGRSARARLLRAFVTTTVGVVLAIDLLRVYAPWIFFEDDPIMSGVAIAAFALITGALIARVALKVGDDMDRSEEIRRRAEDKLRESEDRYRDLVEHSQELICTHDLDGRILSVNPWASQVLGYGPDELLKMNFSDILAPEVRPLFGKYLDEIRTQGVARGLLAVRTRSGERLLWEYKNTLRTDGVTAPVVRGMAQDVTERKRVEAQLRSSEERYRSLFENMSEGYAYCRVIHDGGRPVDFLYLSVNDAFGTLTGLRDVVGKKVSEVIPGIRESDPQLFEIYGRVASTGKPERFETYVEALGHWFSISVFCPKKGHFVAMFDVITERKRAEENLRETTQRLRLATTSGRFGIWDLDLQTDVLIWDERMFELYGVSKDAFSNAFDAWGKSLHPEDCAAATDAVQAAIRGEKEFDMEFRVVHPDGSVKFMQANGIVIRNERGKAVRMIGMNRDVTERRSLEQQLRQSQKIEAVGRLAGGIAHDFNNLLTVINGYSELLLSRMNEQSPLREEVEEIRRAGDRAAVLTRQLLAFSRRQVLQPKVLDLNEAVSNMGKMLRRLIGEDVVFRTVLGADLSSVKADPGQIEQVVMNLVVNAKDAMPGGGTLTIETSNVVLTEEYAHRHLPVQPGPYVMLAVSDTGVGMDEETMSRLFEPFFTTKERGKGTGLGLSTVYGIVKQSGGYVWAYSEPGKGSAFKIYLPRTEELPEVAGQAAPTVEELGGEGTVLVVEDDEPIRTLAGGTLGRCGYTVLAAGDGEEALRIAGAHEGEIRLLLTDVVMPGMGGRELYERLRQLRPGLKVLYMSGYTDDAIVHQGVLDPGTAFLQKPYSPASLARKVKDVLRRG